MRTWLRIQPDADMADVASDGDAGAGALVCRAGPRRISRASALPRSPDGDVRVRALHGAISRGTEAWSRPAVCRRANMSACARPSWPALSVSGQIWLCDGRAGRGRAGACWAERLHAASAPDSFDVPTAAAVPLPDDVPAAARRPRCQHGDRAQCHLGRAPGPAGRIAVVGAGVVGALIGYLCARHQAPTLPWSISIRPRGARARARRNFAVSRACADAIATSSSMPAPAPPDWRPRSIRR